jgi:hypothetical protein
MHSEGRPNTAFQSVNQALRRKRIVALRGIANGHPTLAVCLSQPSPAGWQSNRKILRNRVTGQTLADMLRLLQQIEEAIPATRGLACSQVAIRMKRDYAAALCQSRRVPPAVRNRFGQRCRIGIAARLQASRCGESNQPVRPLETRTHPARDGRASARAIGSPACVARLKKQRNASGLHGLAQRLIEAIPVKMPAVAIGIKDEVVGPDAFVPPRGFVAITRKVMLGIGCRQLEMIQQRVRRRGQTLAERTGRCCILPCDDHDLPAQMNQLEGCGTARRSGADNGGVGFQSQVTL